MKISKATLIRFFKTYALPVLLLTGLGLISVYYIFKWFDNKYWQEHSSGFKEIFGFGLTIVGSGIFLAVLKWFQFMGFFKEELHTIIGSSEFDEKLESAIHNVVYEDRFLQKRKDLDSLWKRVNRALFQNQFSEEVADKIEQKMLDVFFHNSNLSHYYKNFIQTITVQLEEDDFMSFMISTEAKIIRQSEEKFKYDQYYYVEKPTADDKRSLVSFDKIIIDRKEVDLTKTVRATENGLTVKKTFEYDFEGKKEYLIHSKISLRYKMDNDKDEYVFYLERFLDYLRIEVKLSSNLRCFFVPFGNEEFDKVEERADGFIRAYPGILLPEKGFRLIFAKK